ncbi:ABC transporter ATP-binding protein [Geomonas subterranea]|uniref:ABC transporter ATP-binding protein n=1 Tax=Geomonas subterranea TaxID=2847989 RepID=UPI001EF06664|nr:polysaccharide ABC transporter ATP-binding protein [Geomonas subterranea]
MWKQYRLGVVNHHTLALDLQSWWSRVRRREDPNSIVGGSCARHGGDQFWALKDVSFEVRQGDVLGIIGRNGAGKSTLLKILSRVTAPSRGEVRYKGRIASLLEVGTGFHPELTGRENVFLNGAILGLSKADIRKRFDEIVSFAEIDAFIDTPVKRYSSGMYVRLAFAVAAHLDPEILVVDEVLAVGDAQFQAKCLGKMQDVGTQGRTVLFVSHNMQAMRQLCGRAILLREGEIVVDGTPQAAIEEYLREGSRGADCGSLDQLLRDLPADPVFRFDRIALRQHGRDVQQSVENGTALEVEIAYQVLQRTSGLRVFLDLYDDQGTLLFRSFNDEDGDGIPTVEAGGFLSRVEIPADLLAPTSYTLKIFATIFNVRTCYPDGISIPLRVERTGKANRAYPAEPIRGKLAPWLRWETITTSKGGTT